MQFTTAHDGEELVSTTLIIVPFLFAEVRGSTIGGLGINPGLPISELNVDKVELIL
jgi:hypothetical protein